MENMREISAAILWTGGKEHQGIPLDYPYRTG
jgi:hypothetical protein